MYETYLFKTLLPLIVWAGKFAYILSITFWAGALWFFAYIIKTITDETSYDHGNVLSDFLRKGKRFFRSFGLASSILSILLILEVYRYSTVSLSYLSFTVDAFLTVASFLFIGELFLVPSLKRFIYVADYMKAENMKDRPAHSAALVSIVRRLCLYEIVPVLFIIISVAAQFSIY